MSRACPWWRQLVGPGDWIGTRYYVGQVRQQGDLSLYAGQRSILAGLTATDAGISTHLGRLEPPLDAGWTRAGCVSLGRGGRTLISRSGLDRLEGI